MTTGKFERLLTMMAEFQDRQIPIHRIAEDLAVTERTAYRYLRIFNDVGIRIRQNQFGCFTTQDIVNETTRHGRKKTRPAKRTKPMNQSDHFGDVNEMMERRPVKIIYERFQFHPDFSKWMAENKNQLLTAEHRMLAEFARFITDSDMNIEQSVDLFLKHYENN
jgi:hypothetical protein